jgi:hypothetical protein
LGVHCRQKVLNAKPSKTWHVDVVVTQQQLSYTQLINNLKWMKVLYNLWVICGSAVGTLLTSHMMDFSLDPYTNKGRLQRILTNFKLQARKLASAHTYFDRSLPKKKFLMLLQDTKKPKTPVSLRVFAANRISAGWLDQ